MSTEMFLVVHLDLGDCPAACRLLHVQLRTYHPGMETWIQGWAPSQILSPRSCIILATKNCLSPKQPGCNNHVTFGLCNVNNVMHKYIHTYMTHTCHLTNYNRMPRLHV